MSRTMQIRLAVLAVALIMSAGVLSAVFLQPQIPEVAGQASE